MKKALFTAIFLTTLALPLAPVARAQVSEPATQEQVSQLEATLRSLLLELISQLQTQIADLLAKQTETNQTVQTLVQQSAQVVVGGVPVLSTPKVTTAILETPSCATVGPYQELGRSVTIPITVEGDWSIIRVSYDQYPKLATYNPQGYAILASNAKQHESQVIQNGSGNNGTNQSWSEHPRFEVMNYPDTYTVTVAVDSNPPTVQSVAVGTCDL